MPYPQPVSPLALESCPPRASTNFDNNDDCDDDGTLLGSDDELDDAARAAKRQRIESLAESYLQGRPLFILSASLRGPFDAGWVNPWKKTRKLKRTGVGVGAASARNRAGDARAAAEPVVQETDLRRPRFREGLSGDLRAAPEVPASSSFSSAAVVSARDSWESSSKFDRQRPARSTARDKRDLAASRSPARSKEPSSLADDRSFAPRGPVDWLKKDRKRMNLNKFDPPSSPTPRVLSRQTENEARRRSTPRSVDSGPRLSPSRVRTPKNTTAKENDKTDTSSPVDKSPRSSRVAVQIQDHSSTDVRISPFPRRISPNHEPGHGSSFRVISSSSQLPRFEYRRRRSRGTSQQAHSNSPADDIAEEAPAAKNADDEQVDVVMPDAQDQSDERHIDANAKDSGSHVHLPKDLRFADNTSASNPESTCPTAPTEQNTCGNLPSAQQVPALLGVSDRITSLHSTAVPKADTEHTMDTNPDTQLSTQEALHHAQKSFQEDLESPEPNHSTTPGQNRRTSRSPNGAAHSVKITPFSRLALSEPEGQPDATMSEKGGMQPMSTQYMIESTTPFTFSTEKKPTARRPGSPQTASPKKQKTAHDSEVSSLSSLSSDSPENDYHTAQPSAEDEASPHPRDRASDYPTTHHSTTQGTAALPFSLSGSTPPTAQDGQGAAESFNLSQAIADAGSWLQHSFDFMRDPRRSSQM
ncbi:hypothetical protein NUU61_004460 [Penicillium alfredii]|uniref:Protamine P1 n=1 Tax=Penicillium alfredii TaxID=1506179 RepID=A0A9W9KE03_9EURO|nr:uncharacterized protein NUU61_004460 [Penicillium alfredii]KAJ5102238.1 hypothetical protein NUU61_004460 [Penicillium alfredii]